MSIRRTEKWPREYAAEIIELKTKEERKSALEKVPTKYRATTEAHVRIYFEKKRSRKK